MLRRTFLKLQEIINTLTGIMLAILCFIIFCQVVMRHGWGNSLSWSEELTRYLFVWVVFLGVNFGIRDDIEIKVDIISTFTHGKIRQLFDVLRYLVTLVVVSYSLIGCFSLVKVGRLALSPTLQIPMYLVYLVFPIGFSLCLVQTLLKLIDVLKAQRRWNVEEEAKE